MENNNWGKKITILTGQPPLSHRVSRRLFHRRGRFTAASPPPHTPPMTAASRRPFEGLLCNVRMGGNYAKSGRKGGVLGWELIFRRF